MGLQSLATGPMHGRFLQILWDTHRPIGTPPLWDDASQDRDAWRSFTQTWLSHRRLQPNTYYQDLHRVCLHGRCLLQVGSTCRLLPMRHEPIEPPYASPYIYLPTPKDDDDLQVIQVCSDGSSRNRKGGSAVAILPPYGDVSQAVVCNNRIHGDCANIRAEVVARIRALKMILTLRRHLGPHIPIKYMTDSSFVLQVLSEAIKPTIYASEINELYDLWSKLCGSVVATHVKGHAGHALNTLADHAAKQALYFSHYRVVYRTADFKHAQMLTSASSPPEFVSWLSS